MLPRAYLFWVAGETSARASSLHKSTIDRTTAFGLAIHLPVLLWAASAALIAHQVFEFGTAASLTLAVACGALIYLLERLVIAAPKNRWVNAGRVLLGCIIAVLGATVVDLSIFEREVALQLRKDRLATIEKQFESDLHGLRSQVADKETSWKESVARAACEADGSCGSRQKGRGPIVKLLEQFADRNREEYEAARARLHQKEMDKAAATERADEVLAESGILSRFQAFHDFSRDRPLVQIAWGLFFLLVLTMELMVVFVKLAFPRTVDDRVEEVRERISAAKADEYQATMTSPLRAAHGLVTSTYLPQGQY